MDEAYTQILAAVLEARQRNERAASLTLFAPTLGQRRRMGLIVDRLIQVYGFTANRIPTRFGLVLELTW